MNKYQHKNQSQTTLQLADSGGNGTRLVDNRQRITIQRKANTTGLPDNLKSGIENLSGHSMDDVKVHYNSSKPAQLNAHAYAQGTTIHLASGQEKHLPHEAWHVVQQKQGRVKPTLQMKGQYINDNRSLESEADRMGARAIQLASRNTSHTYSATLKNNQMPNTVAQLVTRVNWTTQNFQYNDAIGGLQNQIVGKKMEADLDPADMRIGNTTTSHEMPALFNRLNTNWNAGAMGWVRGHLLNAHLGGPNTDANLFPITGHANSAHLHQVESHVKDWMRANREVRYEVTASQNGGNVGALRNATGQFHCYAYTTDAGVRQVVNKTIHSNPVPAGNAVGYAAGVARHTRNWYQYNDNNAGHGNAGNHGLAGAVGGLGNGPRAALMAGQARRGWLGGRYYEL
jgi:hypothetical protein